TCRRTAAPTPRARAARERPAARAPHRGSMSRGALVYLIHRTTGGSEARHAIATLDGDVDLARPRRAGRARGAARGRRLRRAARADAEAARLPPAAAREPRARARQPALRGSRGRRLARSGDLAGAAKRDVAGRRPARARSARTRHRLLRLP